MSVNGRPFRHAAFLLAVSLAGTALDGRATDAPVPAPPAAEQRRQRAVFVCDDAGTPVFSDRPCGPAAAPRALRLDEPSRASPGAGMRPPTPPAGTRPRVPPRDANEPGRSTDTRCATLQQQLDELNDRMRTGYSSREAARLWQRWRDLRQRLRTQRC